MAEGAREGAGAVTVWRCGCVGGVVGEEAQAPVHLVGEGVVEDVDAVAGGEGFDGLGSD